MIVTVTKEQAAYLNAKLAARDVANREAQTALDALTVGHVPANATLERIDMDGALHFAVTAAVTTDG